MRACLKIFKFKLVYIIKIALTYYIAQRWITCWIVRCWKTRILRYRSCWVLRRPTVFPGPLTDWHITPWLKQKTVLKYRLDRKSPFGRVGQTSTKGTDAVESRVCVVKKIIKNHIMLKYIIMLYFQIDLGSATFCETVIIHSRNHREEIKLKYGYYYFIFLIIGIIL